MLTLPLLIPASISLYKVVNYDVKSVLVLKIMSNFQVYEARDKHPTSNATDQTYQSTTAGLLSENSRGDSAYFTQNNTVRTATIKSGEYTEYITQGKVGIDF